MAKTPFTTRYSRAFLREVYKQGSVKVFQEHIDYMLGGIDYHRNEYVNSSSCPDEQYASLEMATHYEFWKDQFIGAQMDMYDEAS